MIFRGHSLVYRSVPPTNYSLRIHTPLPPNSRMIDGRKKKHESPGHRIGLLSGKSRSLSGHVSTGFLRDLKEDLKVNVKCHPP